MSKTWGVIRAELAEGLNDATFQTHTDASLMAAYNMALAAFASAHTPALSRITYTGDGETKAFGLPDNMVSGDDQGVFGILWSDGSTWLRELSPTPGRRHDAQNTYILYLNYVEFYTAPDSGDEVVLYYAAYYPEVSAADNVVDVTQWAFEALNYYAMSYAVNKTLVQRGTLAVHQQRLQAGTPEDNSMIRLADYWLKRYWDILRVHRKPQFDRIGT
jgi:hypothetical protein